MVNALVVCTVCCRVGGSRPPASLHGRDTRIHVFRDVLETGRIRERINLKSSNSIHTIVQFVVALRPAKTSILANLILHCD